MHAGSIDVARLAASAAGVDDRVSFAVADAADDLGSDYDLVCFFDSFHHAGDPVAAARHARAALRRDGVLMLVEPRAGDRVEDNRNVVGLTYSAASTLVCVPDALSQGATEALGGQAGPARLEEVLLRAGFTRVRVAAEAPFNLVVEARP
ncbi:MAG: methyltransferase domain-containing protein [Egibacteraceae bacterium]